MKSYYMFYKLKCDYIKTLTPFYSLFSQWENSKHKPSKQLFGLIKTEAIFFLTITMYT